MQSSVERGKRGSVVLFVIERDGAADMVHVGRILWGEEKKVSDRKLKSGRPRLEAEKTRRFSLHSTLQQGKHECVRSIASLLIVAMMSARKKQPAAAAAAVAEVQRSGSSSSSKKQQRQEQLQQPSLGGLSFDELLSGMNAKATANPAPSASASRSSQKHKQSVELAAGYRQPSPASSANGGAKQQQQHRHRQQKPAARSSGSSNTVSGHKAALASLAEKDPEFHAFLQSNSKELLEFGQDSDDEDDSDEEGGFGGAAVGAADADDEGAVQQQSAVSVSKGRASATATAGGDDDSGDEEEGDEEEGSESDASGPLGAAYGDDVDGGDDDSDDGDSDDGELMPEDEDDVLGSSRPSKRAHKTRDDDTEEDEGADGGDSDDEQGEAPSLSQQQQRRKGKGPVLLTAPMLRALLIGGLGGNAAPSSGGAASSPAAPSYSLRGLARLLHAYRAACLSGDDAQIRAQLAEETDAPPPKRKPGKKGDPAAAAAAPAPPPVLRYRVASATVYMGVVVNTQRRIHAAFGALLGTRGGGARRGSSSSGGSSSGSTGAPTAPTATVPVHTTAISTVGPAPRVPLSEYSGWKALSPLVRSFITSTAALLEASTSTSLRTFILRCAAACIVPYLPAFPRLIKRWLRLVLGAFGAGESEDNSLRLAAFLRARQIGIACPYPAIDAVLKGLYSTYVKHAKFMSGHGAAGVLLMANCVAEAFGIDEAASYAHAFVYVRQLAMHLRTALTTASKASVDTVGSWQFVNCLRVWTAVVSRYGGHADGDAAHPLSALAFPLVQVLLGTARLCSPARYVPLRLHVAGMLIELSWATGLYIPVAPLLLDVLLRTPALASRPASAAPVHGNPVELSIMVKMGGTTMASRAGQDAFVGRALDLLLDGMKAHYASVSLPEMLIPVLSGLRAFSKATRVAPWRGRARALIDAFTAQAGLVAVRRASLPPPS